MRPFLFILSFFFATSALSEPRIERIGDRLNHPWGMDFLDEAHILVTERRGTVFKINLVDGVKTQIKGVPDVFHVGQGGLLDVAVPRKDPGAIYFCYARPVESGGATAIGRGTLNGNRLKNVTTLFTSNAANGGGRHFGCRLEITDEYIFATLGDRGQRFDAQDPKSHSGSVIRLNRDGTWPSDNPNLDSWRPELFTKGQRNPQGLARNPATGEIWLHEHGPRGGDEINIVRPGKNYGWPDVSHGEEYAGGKIGIGTSAPQFEDPIWVWVPSIAPSGMAFYEAEMFPEYRGHLLVGSLKFKSLYLVELKDNRPISEKVLFQDLIGRIRDVAVAPDGAILLLTDESNGGVFRLYQ